MIAAVAGLYDDDGGVLPFYNYYIECHYYVASVYVYCVRVLVSIGRQFVIFEHH